MKSAKASNKSREGGKPPNLKLVLGEKTDPGRPKSGPAILVVEPKFSSQSGFRILLEQFGLHNVIITGRGYRAVELGEHQKFDIIFIANPLVQLEGVDVIEVLRERGLNTQTPIVFIGQSENDYLIKKAIRCGATTSVHKPLTTTAIRGVLEETLRLRLTTPEEEMARVQASMEPMRRAVEFAKNLRSKGEFELAEEEFKKGVVEIFCGLAEVYLSKGDEEAAEAAIAEAEQIDPHARENFGIREENFVEQWQACLKKKEHLGAKIEFTAALTLNEESVPALIGMGEAQTTLGENLDAQETFERLMNVSAGAGPSDLKILKKMALIACRNRQFDLAWLALNRAIELHPNDAKLHYLKAVAYIAEGNVENTIFPLERALSLDPELTEARTLQKKAHTLIEAGRVQKKSKPKKEKVLEDFLIH
jgi:tetratricopeptide (TPR) repeat protein